MDVLLSAILLVLLIPVFALVAMIVKVTSPGDVFYRQRRSGLGGREFTMFKFRTMTNNADELQSKLLHLSEQDGPAFKIEHDPRVTPIGRVLRKISIDELPQLWNVLIGDMSLIGPRPLPCNETDGCEAWQRRRLDVTPGITCIWQVEGRSQVSFDEWMRMDIRYIQKRSFLTDLKLLLGTLRAVVFATGR